MSKSRAAKSQGVLEDFPPDGDELGGRPSSSGDVELQPISGSSCSGGSSGSSCAALAPAASDFSGIRRGGTALPPMLPPAKSSSSATTKKNKEARLVYSTVANPVWGEAAASEGDDSEVVEEGSEVRFNRDGFSPGLGDGGFCDSPGQSPSRPREPGAEKRSGGEEVPSMWL